MSNKYSIVDGHVELEELPKKFKKLTGTRFASVLGLNVWSTPFEIWCAVTKTYEKPFEDTVYTKAGKEIEPKIIQYLRTRYFMEIKDPTQVFGENYFSRTFGDFYPEQDVLGGMWDALGDDYVVEIKTTKRAEDWLNGAPEYYKLQAALYAYLLDMDRFTMVVGFLEPEHYENPDTFVPSVDNTLIYEYSISEEYPNFYEDYIQPALQWWNDFVLTGVSPAFDEKKDAEILKALRKNVVKADEPDIEKLMKEADKLQDQVERHDAKIAGKRERLKLINDQVKQYMSEKFRDGDNKVEIATDRYTWTLSQSDRASVDSAALKKAGLYDQYVKRSTVLTLKKTIIEEEN